MRQVIRPPETLRGQVSPPGDKSVSHRALILSSIAKGQSKIKGLSRGEDVLATMECLKTLGVAFKTGPDEDLTVLPPGDRLQEPDRVLDAANSGTTIRLLAGLLSGQPFLSVLSGDQSLRSRPMDRIVQPLKLMGAHVHGRGLDTLAPVVIFGGSLKGIEYVMPVASAQVKSSIMLAGLFAEGETILHQPALSRDHTERMIRAMGGEVKEDGLTVSLNPSTLSPVEFHVAGDISAAAFWIVAGLCHPSARIKITGVGMNPTRTGILEALDAMGARVTQKNARLEGGEPVADLLVESADLEATEVGGALIPKMVDEVPVLAVAACFAKGTTVIRDAQELRVKESDRISTTVGELSRLGANIEELPDGMAIHGTGRLRGAECYSHGDHRLAMALGVAGMLSERETVVEEAEAAGISYPQFWEQLEQLSNSEAREG